MAYKLLERGTGETPSTGWTEPKSFKLIERSSSEPTDFSDESLPSTAARYATYGLGKAASAIADIPSNLAKLGGHAYNAGVKLGTVAQNLPYNLGIEEKPDVEKGTEPYFNVENIPNVSDWTTKPLLKAITPKGWIDEESSETQKKVGEAIEDFTSFATAGASKGIAAGAAIGGTLAKWAAESVGASPTVAGGVKLGTQLLASVLPRSIKGLHKYNKELYNKVDEAIPANASARVKVLEPLTKQLDRRVSLGLKDDSNAYLKKINDQIKEKIQGASKVYRVKPDKSIKPSTATANKTGKGNIAKEFHQTSKGGELELKELSHMSKQLNNDIFNDKVPKFAKHLTNELRDRIDTILGRELKKTQPQAYSDLMEAKEIFSALHNQEPVTEFLTKNVNEKNLGYLSGLVLLGKAPLKKAAGLVTAGLTAREVTQVWDAFKQSPAVRKYYKNLIKAAAHKQKNVFLREVAKFDKATRDYEEKHTIQES